MKTKAWLIKKMGFYNGHANFRLSLEGGGVALMQNVPMSLRQYEEKLLGEELTIDLAGVPDTRKPN
jgi:hypothetical protein